MFMQQHKMFSKLGTIKASKLFENEKKRADTEEENSFGNLKRTSWFVTPYFMLYFTTFIINSLVWPLYIMERLCQEIHFGPKFTLYSVQNTTKGSCIDTFMTTKFTNHTTKTKDNISEINTVTVNYMIVGSILGAVLSLISYFIMWKPVTRKCKPLAILLPPICILCQCVLFSYSLTISNTNTFKYVVLAGVLLPCLHCNFQGVFLLMFELTNEDNDVTKIRQREIGTVKIEGSYATILFSFVMSGAIIAFCFDMSYSVLFVLQFTMGLLTTLYGAMLLPFKNIGCLDGTESDEEKEKGTITDNGEDDEDFLDTSDEEEIFLMRRSQGQNEVSLFTKDGNILNEAPMIFSETSYRKELLIIVEISIFTIALVSDSMISGPYLIQAPFNLTVGRYGYCIAAQGVSKIFGIFVIQTITYFKPLKHGGLVVLGGLNTVLYYTLLGVVQDVYALYGVMVINIFGGILLPTIASFIKINFSDTRQTVLEISMISSLIVNVGFHGIEYYIYSVTRTIFPGTIFLVTAALILLGFMVAGVTYFTTTVRNKRKTKEITDKLLNDYR